LSSKNISTKCPSKKLDHKFLGPFEIIKKIGSHAYELKLPSSMQVHPVFHVSLLSPSNNPNYPDIPSRVIPPPPPVEVQGQQEFFVREILNSRHFRGKLQYLVAWEGYPDPSDNSWEPATNFDSDQQFILDFHQKYPGKPQ